MFANTSVSAGEPDHNFDGAWDTVLSCEDTAGTQVYSFKFPSVVKDGVLHGEKGTKEKPGWLQLDGKTLTDGSAKIYAEGFPVSDMEEFPKRDLKAYNAGHGLLN